MRLLYRYRTTSSQILMSFGVMNTAISSLTTFESLSLRSFWIDFNLPKSKVLRDHPNKCAIIILRNFSSAQSAGSLNLDMNYSFIGFDDFPKRQKLTALPVNDISCCHLRRSKSSKLSSKMSCPRQ